MLAERHGGVRGLAREMAKQDGDNLESTLRRWLGLAQSEPRPIDELNRIVARLSKFSRTEIKKLQRRIRSEAGPAGDRQAILAHISLLKGAEKPVVPKPEETLAVPVIFVIIGLLVALVPQIAEKLRSSDVHAQLDPPAAIVSR